jgi:hypothetical protein
MQDWITDSHDTFHQALKTATELYAEEYSNEKYNDIADIDCIAG